MSILDTSVFTMSGDPLLLPNPKCKEFIYTLISARLTNLLARLPTTIKPLYTRAVGMKQNVSSSQQRTDPEAPERLHLEVARKPVLFVSDVVVP